MSDKARRAKLRELMEKHGLNAETVGAITFRRAQTVRAWTCGARRTPAYAIKLLESTVARR